MSTVVEIVRITKFAGGLIYYNAPEYVDDYVRQFGDVRDPFGANCRIVLDTKTLDLQNKALKVLESFNQPVVILFHDPDHGGAVFFNAPPNVVDGASLYGYAYPDTWHMHSGTRCVYLSTNNPRDFAAALTYLRSFIEADKPVKLQKAPAVQPVVKNVRFGNGDANQKDIIFEADDANWELILALYPDRGTYYAARTFGQHKISTDSRCVCITYGYNRADKQAKYDALLAAVRSWEVKPESAEAKWPPSASTLIEPQKKTSFKLTRRMREIGVIYVACDPQQVAVLEKYGKVDSAGLQNQYHLQVDPRFDFAEVETYLTAYEPDQKVPAKTGLTWAEIEKVLNSDTEHVNNLVAGIFSAEYLKGRKATNSSLRFHIARIKAQQ